VRLLKRESSNDGVMTCTANGENLGSTASWRRGAIGYLFSLCGLPARGKSDTLPRSGAVLLP
jgi:hypothetical protein